MKKEVYAKVFEHVFRILILCFLSIIVIRMLLVIEHLHSDVEKLDRERHFARRETTIFL